MKRIHKAGASTVVSAILLALVLLLGGSCIALAIYLEARGLLEGAILTVLTYFKFGAKSVFVLFWGLAFPFLLLIFLLFYVLRRRKTDAVRAKWEKGLTHAIEAERRAFAKAEAQRPVRFDLSVEKREEGERGEISSLRELCERFCAFSAGKLGLYYSEAEVRAFVAGVAVSHILILEGMSGVGKTSLAYAFGEFLGNPSTVVPVQPTWKERSDLLGYYNEFTKKFNETLLFRKMYEANGSDEIFITVLDEMNLSRVEYYFAEFLSLLEIPNPESRYLEIVSDTWESDPSGLKNGAIKLPENMWFVGTVNSHDAAYPISDKVYDRAMILRLDGKTQPFEAEAGTPIYLPYADFLRLVKEAEEQPVSKENLARLSAVDEALANGLQISFGNRILHQILSFVPVYVACGGTEEEALDAVLARKVLRKLDYKDVSRYKKELETFSAFLYELFEGCEMRECRKVLSAALLAE